MSERALEIATLAPGAHRLATALRSERADGSADLPTASFESAAASSLADRLGRRPATAVQEEPS